MKLLIDQRLVVAMADVITTDEEGFHVVNGARYAPDYRIVDVAVVPEGMEPGWCNYDNGAWAAIPKPAPEPGPVPIAISPRQIRQALSRAALRDAVEAAIASGSQDLRDWWEFATQFERSHPMVIALAEQLGVSDARLDDLWRLGASL